MVGSPLRFYEELADHYHLIFDDWDAAIERQARVLGPLLASRLPAHPLTILDCACGIGTQALGLAALGHRVVASDLSGAEVERARDEARRRSLDIPCCVSDMTSLAEITESDFDVVMAFDNALPHLDPVQLERAVAAIASKLRPGGLFAASIRDYDRLVREKPTLQAPAFHGIPGERRIVHQVWDWVRDDAYRVHLYITVQSGEEWQTRHFVSEYRCLLRDELSGALRKAGFGGIEWLAPAESGFYQPWVLARRAA